MPSRKASTTASASAIPAVRIVHAIPVSTTPVTSHAIEPPARTRASAATATAETAKNGISVSGSTAYLIEYTDSTVRSTTAVVSVDVSRRSVRSAIHDATIATASAAMPRSMNPAGPASPATSSAARSTG